MLLFAVLVLLALILAPQFKSNKYLTSPIFFLCLGILVFLLPVSWELPQLTGEPWGIKRISELGVIVALASAGLKIDDPFEWSSWRISSRLLVITMPLTIFMTAFLGWYALGLVPASALLFGAVVAPTDPVLADEVQTSEPSSPDDSSTRLALTTEAGLNDGLAFPFTYLAIAVAVYGLNPDLWLMDWLLIDVLYKIGIGVLAGVVTGKGLTFLFFQTADKRPSEIIGGVFAICLVLIPYSVAELVSSYGFISVFIAACVFRKQEMEHEFQQDIHDFSVTMEQLLEAILMLLVGGYIAMGMLEPLSLEMIAGALVILFIIRPICSFLAFPGSGLPRPKQWVIAFYGIRGIGSIYYLSYGIYYADFPGAEELWALVLFIITISVFVHGISAKPVMDMLDRWRYQNG